MVIYEVTKDTGKLYRHTCLFYLLLLRRYQRRWYNCFRGSYSTLSAALPSGSWVFNIRKPLFI